MQHSIRSLLREEFWQSDRVFLRVQHAMSFAMAPYLLGFKGPAQCIEFEPKPMKVHVVPRSGAEPQVTLLRCKALCAALCALAAAEVLVRPTHLLKMDWVLHYWRSQELAVEATFCFDCSRLMVSLAQVYEMEQSFLIHHANAFEKGDELEVWSSGWGPQALGRLASGAGMLGSWKVVLEGDFTGIPFTALWRHRCVLR